MTETEIRSAWAAGRDLRWSDRELAMAGKLAPPSGKWEADFGDGFEAIDIADFMQCNAETMWHEMTPMWYCRRGESVTFGGGAAPVVVLRRVG